MSLFSLTWSGLAWLALLSYFHGTLLAYAINAAAAVALGRGKSFFVRKVSFFAMAMEGIDVTIRNKNGSVDAAKIERVGLHFAVAAAIRCEVGGNCGGRR